MIKTNEILTLDCTLRDGGYYTNWDFTDDLVEDYFRYTNQLPIDFIEVGYLSKEKEVYHGAFFYLPGSVLERCCHLSDHRIAVMVNEKDIESSEVHLLLSPAKNKVDLVRLAVKPENLERSLETGRAIKAMGFKVALNLMYASDWKGNYPSGEILSRINKEFDYFYVVDSYGGLFPADVKKIFKYLVACLSIPIGFHGHNNLELALANSLAAVENNAGIIDATIMGMGRGAGNLRTELLLSIFYRDKKFNVDFDILNSITERFADFKEKYKWGTNLPYMVSGLKSLPQDAVMSKIKKRYFSLNGFKSENGSKKETVEGFQYVLPTNYQRALLVGGGNSVSKHKEGLNEFLQNNPDILILYASSKNVKSLKDSPNFHLHFLAGNEGKRLKFELENFNLTNRAGVLVPDFFSTLNIVPKDLRDHVLKLKNEDFDENYKRSITALILQFCRQINISTLFITGYDGYGNSLTKTEFELFEENLQVFEDFKEKLEMFSLTPTEYHLNSKSIYTLI